MIQKLIIHNKLCIIHGGYFSCLCTSGDFEIMPAVLRMNIDKNPVCLRVSLGFLHWSGDSPKCSPTFHNCFHGAPVPVIRDSSYSHGWPECPDGVWFSPEIVASTFTLHVLSHMSGGSQWLKYILLIHPLAKMDRSGVISNNEIDCKKFSYSIGECHHVSELSNCISRSAPINSEE